MKTRILSVLAGLYCVTAHAELQTVPYVDVSRYLGTWYQIARNPHQFEGDCYCSRQQLSARSDGKVEVYNTCNDGAVNGPFRTISGEATNEDPKTNAKFSVDFHLPHLGEYWIIALDSDYRYAVVSDPSMYSLYVLSKTPTLDPSLYAKALEDAGRQLDLSKLKMTVQTGCTYP